MNLRRFQDYIAEGVIMADKKKINITDPIEVKKDRRFAYHIYPETSFDKLAERMQELECQNRRIAVITDSNVEKLYLDEVVGCLKGCCAGVSSYVIPAGESHKNLDEIRELLYREADAIQAEDVQISRNIGEIGFGLLKKLKKEGEPVGILTHCNAGTLATAKYGTATAPMYIALEHGWAGSDMHVYCDETRPLLQGARLTSFELNSAGITTTVQCDNMASLLMKSGKIDIIFVGCDRVAANGDAANKIGTSGVAILAKHYGIPFYVCAPSSTIDRNTPTGEQIPIEMRDPDEVTQMWYKERMAPQGINVFNPAFDVTDHSLITGMITEKGLCTDPFDKDFDKYGI